MCFAVYVWGPGSQNWVQKKEIRDKKLNQCPAQVWMLTPHSTVHVTNFVLHYRMLLCIVIQYTYCYSCVLLVCTSDVPPATLHNSHTFSKSPTIMFLQLNDLLHTTRKLMVFSINNLLCTVQQNMILKMFLQFEWFVTHTRKGTLSVWTTWCDLSMLLSPTDLLRTWQI